MSGKTRSTLLVLCLLWLTAPPVSAQPAGDPVSERALRRRRDILYFLDFNDRDRAEKWFRGSRGYAWTGRKANVLAGTGALEIQQTRGTHLPMEIHPEIAPSDRVYVRWYRRWEKDYDFTQHKMPGVYATAGRTSGAGVRPTGRDKFSCKLFVDSRRFPALYTYHPDQKGRYGDHLKQNIGEPVRVEAERWYCFEMMIQANNAPQRDGELKMWIDGELKAHHVNLHFRDTNALKINLFTYSAYVGGTWVSKRDQKLWDDQIVVARKYIGPLDGPAAKEKPSKFSPPVGYERGD